MWGIEHIGSSFSVLSYTPPVCHCPWKKSRVKVYLSILHADFKRHLQIEWTNHRRELSGPLGDSGYTAS